jgi:hypothetical protein
MKITEITEGWGQYSNKSNHRMNKFKRNEEVDEAEFGQWASAKGKAALGSVGRGVGAVGKGAKNLGRLGTGAVARQVKDMGRGVAAKAGFAGPAEKQKMQRIAGGVAKNFKAWTTQRGLAQEVDALQQYLSAVGFNPADVKMSAGNTAMWEGEVSEAVPSNDQITSAKAKGQAKQQAQDMGPSRGAQPLNRTELIKTIAGTIQSAIKNNRVPKAIEKFTKV